MASSRKKQDELNLKTLRELAALPQNKFCFDCGQRGPTYVNVTVGSFVCTKCSGILRGITPPHRVKSISMATFTTEEIDSIRNKGNDYCRKVWLGLYEGTPPVFSDELQVRDFMVEKYERKRHYLEKNMSKPEVPNTRPWTASAINGTHTKLTNGTKNGLNRNLSNNNIVNGVIPNGVITNGTSRSRPEVKNHHQQNGLNNNLGSTFAVDFDKADIFSNTSASSTGSSQGGFADFEHNQVYNANSNSTNGMPTSSNLNAWATQPPPVNLQNGIGSTTVVNSTPAPLIQDKYAALKDLDNEMKQAQQQDIWSTSNTGSTGSLYSSSTPNTGSAYGSPSPQSSIFGSPSQGQFLSTFPQDTTNQTANPFGSSNQSGTAWPATNGFSNSNGFVSASSGYNGNINSLNNGVNGLNCSSGSQTAQAQTGFINPFRDQLGKNNGLSNGFQPAFPSNGLTSTWGGNPFKIGAVTAPANPNNPFL